MILWKALTSAFLHGKGRLLKRDIVYKICPTKTNKSPQEKSDLVEGVDFFVLYDKGIFLKRDIVYKICPAKKILSSQEKSDLVESVDFFVPVRER